MPYTILRPSAIYGKGDNKNIMELARLIKKFPIVPVLGNGKYKMQPVFVDDISNIIIKSLKLKNKKTYDVCSDQLLSLNEIIDIIAKKFKKRILKIHLPLSLAGPFVKIYETIFPNPIITSKQLSYMTQTNKLDNSEIKKDLGFEFTDFTKGISKSV